jgi:hypothetical protein
VKKIIALIAAPLLVVTLAISPVRAQTDITIAALEAAYSFGQHITFHLQATAPTPIVEINLFFRVQGQSDTTAIPIAIDDPSPTLSVDYAHSLVGQNIPPFASLTYWWEIHDQSGARARSEEKLLYYADNRYDWQSIEGEGKDVHWSVYWVQGDVVFGQTALNVAVKSLDEIQRDLGTPVPSDIRIYVYPSEEDLQSALNLSGYEWAGGQARPELNAILVGIPNTLSAPGEMDRLIPHELSHLLVYQAVGQRLGQVPPWLDEGLASLYERRPDPDRQALLEQALEQDRLFSLEALCASFPIDESTARLAYAQSASVVAYLREQYGSQVLHDLLMAYADNASCEAGVTRVLGKNLKGLETAWRADLAQQGQVSIALREGAVWLALWILITLLALPFVGVLQGRKKPASSM